jgi:hypothetical protein
MSHHVILVAFTVEGGESTRSEAMELVMNHVGGIGEYMRDNPTVTSWWIAEDDRIDGSDCDSAVFCHPGQQAAASRVLYNTVATDPHTGLRHEPLQSMTGVQNLVSREVRGQFDGSQV